MKHFNTFENIFNQVPYGAGDPKTDKFITDYGTEPIIFKNSETGEEIHIPRFGVWAVKGHRKPTVIDTGDNLITLLNKHNIPEDRVYQEKELTNN
jgi:hypothetical protein